MANCHAPAGHAQRRCSHSNAASAVQTGVLEYPKEDSMTTMDRVKRFSQRKEGAAPETPPKTPGTATPKQKRVRA